MSRRPDRLVEAERNRRPGSAAQNVPHLGLAERRTSPSGCTCTDKFAEVNRNFTRIGSGGWAVNQASPSFRPSAFPAGGNQGARSRDAPDPFVECRSQSDRIGANSCDLRRDEFVDAVETALQFLHRRGVGDADVAGRCRTPRRAPPRRAPRPAAARRTACVFAMPFLPNAAPIFG